MENILANRYEVQKQLGKKAGRQTLLAKDLNTEQLVIVKLLSFSSDFQWDDLKLFEREAETLKSLSHPYIPSYLDYFEINSSEFKGFALIQTYIPAKTLEQYLQIGRKFTETELKEIASSVLEILIYLHGLNPPVIHRDIKPSNILLGERSGNSVGEVYLVDFGSVQTVMSSETVTRTIVGTYGYMPQEQFGGRTVPASDLYSLGATLIYLATGTQPADLPQKDFRIQFEQIAHLSPSLTNWLKRIAEPSLEKRFISASEALTVLEQPQYTDITALTVDKPAGSKIQVIKNEEVLEITMHSVGFKPLMIFSYLLTVGGNLSILILTIIFLSDPSTRNFSTLIALLVFIPLGLYMIYGLIDDLFGSLKICIDNRQIIRDHYVGKWRISRRILVRRESINKLVYIPKSIIQNVKGVNRMQLPELVICVKEEKFAFNVNGTTIKSEAELEWLAHELSNWLGIEISRNL
ncbi:serine/threonine protein kinase [Anabaena sp. WFMT]|uniref:serine/threonine protein kinase n=1 Tax=Anabaena sp. WFMT TaxID=3449730 RepID=UPI003F26925B